MTTDYSTIDEILNTIPEATAESSLNVIIVTKNASCSSLDGLGKSDGASSEKPGSPQKRKPFPVYSVVNKKFKTKDSSRDIKSSEAEFSVVEANPSLDNHQSHDPHTHSNRESTFPPPPIPPRTYEVDEIESSLNGNIDEKTGNEEELKSSGGGDNLKEDMTSSAAESDVAMFTVQRSQYNRRNSYETVDLVLPEQ